MKNKLDKMFESDFVRVPRPFIRRFNLNTAVMLSEIYSEYTYWRERDGLQQGGWFFSTIEPTALLKPVSIFPISIFRIDLR